MTFRAKPVAKRPQKHSWESHDRRNLYLNIGFGLVVLAAVAILVIAVVASYYDSNLASVGSVDGKSITKAELRDRVTVEKWRVDEAAGRIRTLTLAGRLTPAEAGLLVALARRPGAVLSRDQLLDAVTRRPDDVVDRVVDVHVANLRRKLGDDPADPWLIETIPQTGYRLIAPRDPGSAAGPS